jgi:hypothetical protein
MLIRDTFATAIQQRIEPVVKVVDRKPSVLLGELRNLVVTPQWERHLRGILDIYSETADREDEQGNGIWISGFFGSGKSLLVKTLGVLLEGPELNGQSAHELFLERLPLHSSDRAAIGRYLTIIKRKVNTAVVGGNLHAMLARDEPLVLIAFKLFAHERGFTQSWPFGWAIEYQLDERGKTEEFRQRASELAGADWEELRLDPEFYLENLYAAAAATLPATFSSPAAVERAVSMVQQGGIDATMLVDRLRRWCAARDGGGRRQKLLLQLDELGQWIAGGNPTSRAQQVQALIETAATNGGGRIWIAVTAHGDVQELQSNMQQEQYAKINQRFANKCKLTNEDISKVVEERLLRKTQPARIALAQRFNERIGDLTDLGTVQGRRVYPAPEAASFALFYPYMPWTVSIIPDVVKGIAQAVGREEALTGSNRTMIGVVQGGIIETPGLLDQSVGRLLSLTDLYDQLASDAPIETKTDLNRIRESVPGATEFTPRVARALYLLGEAEYVPTTIEHVARALADTIDVNLPEIQAKVRIELERLVAAGFAKQVGDTYSFLTTQQRGFQDRVRGRQEELAGKTYDLSQALKEFDSDDALRFDKVPLHEREIAFKLEIDGRVARNPTAHVTLRVASPLQRALDTQLDNDGVMKQRSNEDGNAVLIRLDDVQGLRAMLSLALATEQIATDVLSSTLTSDTEKDIARLARQNDLQSHRAEVRRLIALAVKGAKLFFRGSSYDPTPGESAGPAIRSTLSQIALQIYSRAHELPQQIGNEDAAIRDALRNVMSNSDLKALNVYRADGTLNDAHPLLSTLRARLPIDDGYQQFVQADALRSELERPPFGWDPKAVRIGLALLLRASACRLIDSQRTIADPSDPEAHNALTKETRFKNLRLQGVKSTLSPRELQELRGYVELLFGVKPALVPETMNKAIGEGLSEFSRRAQVVQGWANTARCALPPTIASGADLVAELLNLTAPTARLPRFREQADTLTAFNNALHAAEEFRRDNGEEFLAVSAFFTSMVYAETGLDEVRRFVADWQALNREQSVTEPARWNEALQAYRAARKALDDQVKVWRQETGERLSALDSEFDQRLRAVGVPEEAVGDEKSALLALFADMRQRAARPELNFSDARGMKTALSNVELMLPRRFAELREKYRPEIVEPRELRRSWRELAGATQLTSEGDVNDLLARLRERLMADLDGQTTLIIE